jgi:perosamine synthetase
MDEIFELSRKYNLRVIEDAAHALPSYYKNTIIGGLNSDLTCFSFYATKTLATGEGGMVVTKNDKYAQKIRVNRLHGISKDAWNRYSKKGSWYYEVVDNGNKYNMTDLNAALGVVQLNKLELMYDKRKKIADQYTNAFKKEKNIILPYMKDDRQTSWHLYVIKVKNRDEIIQKLDESGIGTSVHFIPVHKHPYYKDTYNYQDEDYPIANKVFNESISLPIYPDLNANELDYIIKNIIKCVNV